MARFQIDEGIKVVTELEPESAEVSSNQAGLGSVTTPTRAMDSSLTNISREILEEFISPRPSQTVPVPYGGLISQNADITPSRGKPSKPVQDMPLDTAIMGVQIDE